MLLQEFWKNNFYIKHDFFPVKYFWLKIDPFTRVSFDNAETFDLCAF